VFFLLENQNFRLYDLVVHPIVFEYWEDMQKVLLEYAAKEDLKVTGDGQESILFLTSVADPDPF
jgi:hypothetical protein